MKLTNVIQKPVITEKSAKLAGKGKFTFSVAKEASKYQIKAAMEKIYGVEVGKVRTIMSRTRRKRAYKGGKWTKSIYQKAGKKAIVEVTKGKDKVSKLFKF